MTEPTDTYETYRHADHTNGVHVYMAPFAPEPWEPTRKRHIIWLDTQHRRIRWWRPDEAQWTDDPIEVYRVNAVLNQININGYFDLSAEAATRLLGVSVIIDYDAREQENTRYGYRSRTHVIALEPHRAASITTAIEERRIR